MSRFSGENEGAIPILLWESNVRRAIVGKRGQAILAEMEAALLALPERRLIEGAICREGEVCLIGALGIKRHIDAGFSLREARELLAEETRITWSDSEDGGDEHDTTEYAQGLGMTYTLAWHMAFLNDETWSGLTPEARWSTALAWVRKRRTPTDTGEGE